MRQEVVERKIERQLGKGGSEAPLTINLILEICDLLKIHIFFKDQRLPLLIAVWVLASYIYEIFTFFGYLWINSPVKRCGKSLLEDILTQLSCRATPRLSNVSESSVFRLADAGHTLIFDELDNLRKEDKEKYGMIMSILNSGFQSGGKVPRVEKVKGIGFQVVYFNAYSPKVLAGINRLVDTIEDRSFKIPMVRKTKDERVDRFNLRRQAGDLARLRNDLNQWSQTRRRSITELYDGIDEVGDLAPLDDRFKDISEPLVAVVSFADAEAANGERRMMPNLISLLLDMAGKRNENEKQEAIGVFVGLAEEILDSSESIFISTGELLKKTQEIDELSWLESTRALGKFLTRFDLPSTKRLGSDGKQTRGFVLTREWMKEAKNRYSVAYPDSVTSLTSLPRPGSGSEPLFANVPEDREGHHEKGPQPHARTGRGTSGTS